MIDIDLLDQQLEGALTAELRAQLKPIVRPPAPAPVPVRPPTFASFRPRTERTLRNRPSTTPRSAEPESTRAESWLAADLEPTRRRVATPAAKAATPRTKANANANANANAKAKAKPVEQPRPVETKPAPRPSWSAQVAGPVATAATSAPSPVAPGPSVRSEPSPWRAPSLPLGPPASRWTTPTAMPPPFEADLEATAPAPRRRPVLRSRLQLPDRNPDEALARSHRPCPPDPEEPPPEASPFDVGGQTHQIVELVGRGQLAVADRLIATHASFAAENGTVEDKRDAARWATMRATLDGRQADARAASARGLSLGQEAADPEASDQYWKQHAWIVLEWGSDREQDELLDHCRQRAYWKDEPTWRSMLSLVLARLGRVDEAQREFDATAERLPSLPRDGTWLEVTTNLAETAAYLGDARRASQLNRIVDWRATGMVVTGKADVCKGSISRYRALLAATTGRWAEADIDFRTAVDVHRRLGAELLLARTLQEWGRSLAGRDDARARDYLGESARLARQLELAERFTAG